MTDSPLHQQNPTTRFTSRAHDYVRFRPDYPLAAYRVMLEGLGYPNMLTAADIGSGTGISSRQLASLGPLVVAVEPNETMREQAEPHERVLPHAGSAEATGLEAGSIALVLCAQAFHWFDHPRALAEFRRILSGLGRLALMWNIHDTDEPIAAAYYDIMARASGQHPAHRKESLADPLAESPLFTNFREVTFSHPQPLSLDALLGRARSSSYCPPAGTEAHATMTRELTTLFESHATAADPTISLLYRTRLFLAEPAFD